MPEQSQKRIYVRIYEWLVGKPMQRANQAGASNFAIHIASLAATKTGDGLANPKLILAWLLSSLGAPTAAIGLLVPVREALALLPQIVLAPWVSAMPRRKWAWAAGCIVQGGSVIAMAVVALTWEGARAGWAIVGLLAIFATARSLCSVSYKAVLAKTVEKGARGTATGTAGSIAAAIVLAFGICLGGGFIEPSIATISVALMVAGALWLFAAALFSRIIENANDDDIDDRQEQWRADYLSIIRDDPQLVRFIAVRGLLTATALAPPYILALAGEVGQRNLTTLGPFVIASSLAAIVSSFIWGRFADRSSRVVLIAAAAGGAVVLGPLGVTMMLMPSFGSITLAMALAFLLLMIAYQGVRLGRSTHLVDMVGQDKQASYTAISNSAIGVLLLAGGSFGIIADSFGGAVVLVLFSIMCALAALLALGLNDVQNNRGEG